MALLALDLGTRCGWAIRVDGELYSGVWDLSDGIATSPGKRWLNIWARLCGMHDAYQIGLIIYEEVQSHPQPGIKKKNALGQNIKAAHVYGGFEAMLQMWATYRDIPFRKINVTTIKKHATGKGNSKKQAMIEAAKERWPGVEFEDDNEVDARWLLSCWENERAVK